MLINLFIKEGSETKEFNIFTRGLNREVKRVEFWKTLSRIVNGLQLQGLNF